MGQNYELSSDAALQKHRQDCDKKLIKFNCWTEEADIEFSGSKNQISLKYI